MGLDMFSDVTTNPVQKGLYLLFPVSGKTRLRGAALFVAGVHQSCSRLAINELCAPAYTNAVCSQADQNQHDKEVVTEKISQQLNITAVGDIFFCDWEWRQHQVYSLQTQEKHCSHPRASNNLSYARWHDSSGKRPSQQVFHPGWWHTLRKV